MLGPIVDAAWLAGHLDDVVVVEVGGGSSGGGTADDHERGHLPGARFASVDDLAGPAAPVAGRHPLPSPEAFARVLAGLGIGDDDVVVAYDRSGGAFAGRLVWMLRVLGGEAALLDGGADAWTGPVEVGPVASAPAARTAVPWPGGAVASADEVAAHLAAGGTVVDARAAERYRGEVEPLDAVAGHIPGAVNLPFAGNLDQGRFRSPEQLRERFAALAEDPDAIVHCGSGVTACHHALAAEHAGLPRPRVYVGSWSGWSSSPARPVATGDERS